MTVCNVHIHMYIRSQIEKVSAGVGNSNNRPKSEQMQPLYEIQANIKQLLAKIEAASVSIVACVLCVVDSHTKVLLVLVFLSAIV